MRPTDLILIGYIFAYKITKIKPKNLIFGFLFKDLSPHTDGNNILHTPLVQYNNDLLERQSSEWGKDEISYFYIGDVFCIHLWN